jgi:hypothetical protein
VNSLASFIFYASSTNAVSFHALHRARQNDKTCEKELWNATVSRVEADGLVVKTKGGISKVYFTELPKDVQERFPGTATATAATAAAAITAGPSQPL